MDTAITEETRFTHLDVTASATLAVGAKIKESLYFKILEILSEASSSSLGLHSFGLHKII